MPVRMFRPVAPSPAQDARIAHRHATHRGTPRGTQPPRRMPDEPLPRAPQPRCPDHRPACQWLDSRQP